MRRAADLRAQARPAFVDGTAPAATQRRQAAESKGDKAGARSRRELLSRFYPFHFKLANAIVREPERRRAAPADHVRALAARHGAALSRELKDSKIPHARGTSPLVIVPFLLAGYYLVRMLAHPARPPHRPGQAFVNVSDEGQHTIEEEWGRVAMARGLFRLERDQAAWFQNCYNAGAWIEKLRNIPPDSLALVRQCANPACRKFYWTRGTELEGERDSRTCGGRCRTALFRARARRRPPRRNVTGQRSKRKVSGLPAVSASRRSPLFPRRAAR